MAQPEVECVLGGSFAVGGLGGAGDALFDGEEHVARAGCFRRQVRSGGEASEQVAGEDAVLVVARGLKGLYLSLRAYWWVRAALAC